MVATYINPVVDFLLLDGLEPVTVEIEGVNENITIPVLKAHPSAPNAKRDNFADVEITTESQAWSIRKIDLDSAEGVELRRGAVIVDGQGKRWEVQGVTLGSFGAIYRAICNSRRPNE